MTPTRRDALAALVATLCVSVGCASGGSGSIVAGDALFGEVVTHPFRGGGGSILFEDGTVLTVVAPHGAYTYRVPTATLEAIAAALRAADFFGLPANLHNFSVFDASSIDLFVATSTRLHWSSNYAVDDARYRRAQAAMRVRRGGGPTTPLSPEALDAAVAAYIARSRSSARAEAARRWLAAVQAFIERPRPGTLGRPRAYKPRDGRTLGP